MKNTRQSVFETNSSSTHSICVAKGQLIDIPIKIEFNFGEFGWEEDTLSSLNEKASYLYTGIVNYFPEYLSKLTEILKSNGVKEIIYSEKKEGYWDNGYIDHGSELSNFLNTIMNSEDKLLSFLFSPLSFIRTGNDNDDSDISIIVSYEYDEYYKGN